MNVNIRHWLTILIIAYSLTVMATILPGFGRIPGLIVFPYYLVVPGYCLTVLLKQDKQPLDLIFYSLVWSLAVVGSVFSVETLFQGSSALPLSATVPALTLALNVFDYYQR